MGQNRVKPDIVSFCGVPYEFYCGTCGWLVYTCGSGAPERPKACRHCGAELDWSEVEVRKKVKQDAPDREKVIKGLEICTKDIPMSNAVHKSDFCKGCPYYNAENRYCWNQIVMMRDALVLLKEQDAVEPVKMEISGIINDGYHRYYTYDCGCCGKPLLLSSKYCDQCGRAVKWE